MLPCASRSRPPLFLAEGEHESGKEDASRRPPPGSQAGLLPPSPLRTARTGFPISSSSLSNARHRTQLVQLYTQVVNLAMALWMQQQSVTQPIPAPIDWHSPMGSTASKWSTCMARSRIVKIPRGRFLPLLFGM